MQTDMISDFYALACGNARPSNTMSLTLGSLMEDQMQIPTAMDMCAKLQENTSLPFGQGLIFRMLVFMNLFHCRGELGAVWWIWPWVGLLPSMRGNSLGEAKQIVRHNGPNKKMTASPGGAPSNYPEVAGVYPKKMVNHSISRPAGRGSAEKRSAAAGDLQGGDGSGRPGTEGGVPKGGVRSHQASPEAH